MKTLKKRNKKTFKKKEFNSGDGMVTSIWGPSYWHVLHTISFNYPVNPSCEDKKNYRNLILNLKNVLPCKYCRINLENNFKTLPLRDCDLKNRETFSKYVYDLHELVNSMLGKKSGLSYNDVRERYEHFRSRCTKDEINKKIFKQKTHKRRKEKGCTEPLVGKKAKCILKIVPQENKCSTFEVDKKCIKKRID
tara:strand:- start:444 stop:1022 length:579 start_codon:yes stop_codon:yes gene_type:complete